MHTISSVAVTRLMLRIKSLAADLGYDEVWVLNHVELQRLPAWKKGVRDGEIMVDVDSSMSEEQYDSETGKLRPGVHISRAGVGDVGMFDISRFP